MSRFWGWSERLALVVVLLTIATVQISLTSRVFEDASAQTTEALQMAYHVVGLVAYYLSVTVVLGLMSSVVRRLAWLSEENNRVVDHVLAVLGASIVAYQVITTELDFTAEPALAEVVLMFGGVFVLKFVLDSIPFWYIVDRWDPVGSVRGVVGR